MRVVFDLSLGRVVIEGDGPDLIKVLEAAREVAPHITQIQITATSQHASETDSSRPMSRETSVSNISSMTMRQFARKLILANAAERISALAYYANKIEGRPSFSPKEMDGWFTMSGFQKPSQMPVALFDTKRNYGYVENVSRGNWRISNQGENLIIGKLEDQNNGA